MLRRLIRVSSQEWRNTSLIRLALAGALLIGARPAGAAASIWLQKGVSGVGAAAALASGVGHSGGSDYLDLTITNGYSYKGVLELDLQVSRGFPRTLPGNVSLAAWTISPVVEVHPLKQSATIPISLGVSATLAFPSFSSRELAAQGIDMSAFGYGFGLMAYRFFRLAESVGVTPAVAFEFMRLDTTFETPLGAIDGGGNEFGGALGAYFAFLDSGGRIWGVVPAVGFTDDHVRLGLQLGVVLSML